MQGIAALIGAISGVVSLLGIVYMLGRWKGQVDTRLRDICDTISQHPPAETALMAKTLWEIYVVDALRARPDLADHGSAYKLKKEGLDLIPDYMLPLLDCIPHNPGLSEDIATGYLVVKHIGLEMVTKMAEEKELSIPETIALLSTYLEASQNSP